MPRGTGIWATPSFTVPARFWPSPPPHLHLRNETDARCNQEPAAASSLLNASKAIDSAIENIESGKPQSQSPQHDRPGVRRAVSSISSTGSGTGRFDKFGRHVLGSQPPSRPSSVAATMPGTPTGPQDVCALVLENHRLPPSAFSFLFFSLCLSCPP